MSLRQDDEDACRLCPPDSRRMSIFFVSGLFISTITSCLLLVLQIGIIRFEQMSCFVSVKNPVIEK